jgi:hypothetical protein
MCPSAVVSSEHSPSIFDLMRRDHERHLQLIETLRTAKDASDRARRSARLASDLRRHSRSEHTALLCVLLTDSSVRPLARRSVAEHQKLHRLLADLACQTHDELAFGIALRIYRATFLEYARFEEQELHPAALIVLGSARCQRLAERYRDVQREERDSLL